MNENKDFNNTLMEITFKLVKKFHLATKPDLLYKIVESIKYHSKMSASACCIIGLIPNEKGLTESTIYSLVNRCSKINEDLEINLDKNMLSALVREIVTNLMINYYTENLKGPLATKNLIDDLYVLNLISIYIYIKVLIELENIDKLNIGQLKEFTKKIIENMNIKHIVRLIKQSENKIDESL